MFNRVRSYNSEVTRRVGSRAALALVIFVFTLLFGAAKAVAASSSSASTVQVTAASTHTAATALAVTFPGSTTAGDVILVAFDYNSNATATGVTDSQGNAFSIIGIQLTSPGGSHTVIYYANKIKGGADTVTVHLSAASSCIEVYLSEYHGLNTTNPIDAHVGTSGSAATASSGGAATTVAGDIIFGYCLGDWACTAGPGFTARSTLDGNLIEDMVAGKAGAYAATGSASSTWTMKMVALKPALNPAVNLSPTTLSFSSTAVGTASAAQVVTVSNTGNAALSLSSIALTGANAGDFSQTNNCGSSLAAGAHCALNVTFKPTAAGARAAAVTLSDNATGNSTQTVSLAGVEGGAQVSLSASSLTFGAEPVTLAAPTQAVTLTNTGNVALSISNISFTGANAADFSQANTCNSSVAAGAKCTIVVLFTPSAAGARAASLSIADNAGNGAQTVAVAGTGSHDVLLSWNASPSAGIAGYNVYRGTTSGAESSTPLNATPISGTTFTDANVTDGSTYYYVVTAVAANGTTHSAQSNQASALVP
jgi:hypothetical protein